MTGSNASKRDSVQFGTLTIKKEEEKMPPIDEVTWIKTRVIPLFRSLGFKRVDFVHGSLEAGRDIVMADYDHFGLLRYYAVQAKGEDLKARSSTSEINTILDQIRTAFETPYRDPLTGTEHKIAGVYLVINGSITDAGRNILYSKTGGWFSIVDLSQLEIGSVINARRDRRRPKNAHNCFSRGDIREPGFAGRVSSTAATTH